MKKLVSVAAMIVFFITGCLSNIPAVKDCQEKSRKAWGECALGCLDVNVKASVACLGACTLQLGGRFFFSCHKQDPPETPVVPANASIQQTRQQCINGAWYRWEKRNKDCKTQSNVQACYGNSAKQLLYEKKRCGGGS